MRARRLFWKVFMACWWTTVFTGLCIGVLNGLWPGMVVPDVPATGTPPLWPPVLAAAVVSLLPSTLLAWSLSRPIRVLQQAFADAAAGRLDTRAAPRMRGQRDEIADLGASFDHMAQRLQDLLAARQRLLHDVSHELRSPLARLQLAVGLVRQSKMSPQKLESTLQRIETEVQRVDTLVGEVLTLARLDAASQRPPAQPHDVLALLQDVAADAAFEAQASGVAVAFSSELPAFVRPAHRELLARAFDNLIRNALRHSARGSTVEVSAGPGEAGALQVAVADRGPGIPAAQLPRIFEPFYRVQDEGAAATPAGATQVKGYGLGLAIARGALELHGGRVAAQPREGGGLLVRASLPALQPS